MKIRALRNLGSHFPPLKEGEEADVDDPVARAIIKDGCGVEVISDAPKSIKAVPAVAEFNTAPAVEVAPIIAAETEPTEENTAPAVEETGKKKR